MTATLELRTRQDTYLDGMLQGQTAAEGNTEVLLEARMVWSSQAVGFEGALNMANFAAGACGPRTRLAIEEAHRRVLWACGVREGFKLATAGLDGAQECAMCDERVLPERDEAAESCEDHGWFCSPECRNAFCRPTCEWPES